MVENGNGGSPNSSNPRPIWHSPAWITAIVGVISAFLTVPDVIGSYFEKQQDIELAMQKTEKQRLANLEDKQTQEFQIVNNTLAQKGLERVFLLRYLASTLDDDEARTWAKKEVVRLENVASKKEELERARIQLEAKEEELWTRITEGNVEYEELRSLVDGLRRQLQSKNITLEELRQNAGIVTEGVLYGANTNIEDIDGLTDEEALRLVLILENIFPNVVPVFARALDPQGQRFRNGKDAKTFMKAVTSRINRTKDGVETLRNAIASVTMRSELIWFEEDIPDDLTLEQEKQLIDLRLKVGAAEAKIVIRNGNKFLRYAIKL